MAALECAIRQITGSKDTLGKLLRNYCQELNIPRPLDVALAQMWGYASNTARHLIEGNDLTRNEAELLLDVVSVMITYLFGKKDQEQNSPYNNPPLESEVF